MQTDSLSILVEKYRLLKNKQRQLDLEIKSLESELIEILDFNPNHKNKICKPLPSHTVTVYNRVRTSINTKEVCDDWLSMDLELKELFPIEYKLNSKLYPTLKSNDYYADILPKYVRETVTKPIIEVK